MSSSSSSSSSSHASPAASSSKSYKYDVFLSFRGEDTRTTFVNGLYRALDVQQIVTYQDEKSLRKGESIDTALLAAIEESRIAVIIFSKHYICSRWCLDELVHIMKCRGTHKAAGQIHVIPIFYHVEPSELRKGKKLSGKKRNFDDAIHDQKEAKSTEEKAKLYEETVDAASKIAGWPVTEKTANGNESEAIKMIVDDIWKKLQPTDSNSYVDNNFVGMSARVQDLESRIAIGANGVHMIGIWGIGGSGKSALATSLYMKISLDFKWKCIVENVRDASSNYRLKQLQERMLSNILERELRVESSEIGKLKIQQLLQRKEVLVLLDDVDNLSQLEALAGGHDWFGSKSIIIITTRNEHVLSRVDQVYPMRLLSDDEAMRLFNRCAYNYQKRIKDYKKLSSRVVGYAANLPLALKILGYFLSDKNENVWNDTLDKLRSIPDAGIVEKLKISYDGLNALEKELFLDIACFLRGEMKNQAMEILEACDFHPESGIEVLRQKALISIVDGRFHMHNLVQQMGHHIVRGDPPMNPKTHSRVWKFNEIQDMFGDVTMENNNIEAIRYNGYSYNDHPRFCNLVSKLNKLRGLRVWMHDGKCRTGPSFLSNELRYIHWDGYPASPFPDSFQLKKLVVLKLSTSMQIELWTGFKHLPKLKVLQLSNMKKLRSTPDFKGLPHLQKLTLSNCYELKDIHSSLEKHKSLEYVRISSCLKLRMFRKIAHMKKLKTLEIVDCGLVDGEIPDDIGELSNLQELNLSGNNFSQLDFNLSRLTRLKLLSLSGCKQLLKLPDLPSSLAVLNAYECELLNTVGDRDKCKLLPQVSVIGGRINFNNELLLSELEGKAIENYSMLLLLKGLEVANIFKQKVELLGPKLELLRDWKIKYCGFLVCAVLPNAFYWRGSVEISMRSITDGTDSQYDVDWKEGRDNKFTWVAFISFGSLEHTTWWKQTHNVLSFNIEGKGDKRVRGMRVKLVDKTSTSDFSRWFKYAPDFKIERDSACDLSISLSLHNLLRD